YENAARYAGDSSPAADTNGDGHTFNVDFGTSFSTWDLKSFDWKLTDTETQRAIPSTAAFDPGAISNPSGFDAPRVRGVKPAGYCGPTPYFLAFQGLGPAIAGRHMRFSLVEWHPSARSVVGVVPAENPFLFTNELALLEKYRPTILSPFIWNDQSGLYPIKGT